MIGCRANAASAGPLRMNHLTMTNPSVLIAAIGWAQVVPVVLILGGAALFLLAIWRGQFWMRGPSALPTAPPPTGPASPLHNVMRDAEELTGLLAGQVDREAAPLEELLAEGGVKIRHLERLKADD